MLSPFVMIPYFVCLSCLYNYFFNGSKTSLTRKRKKCKYLCKIFFFNALNMAPYSLFSSKRGKVVVVMFL